jgi:glycosyltransferase involved in cell wall biosynthesis
VRVGADGSYLRFQRTGLGRYLDGLLGTLAAELSAADSMVVYYNSFRAPPLFPAPVEERFVRMPRPTAWNQLGVPAAVARDRCDVYLGAANIVPTLGRLPKVVVFHDCLAFTIPSAKPGRITRYLRRWMTASARSATRVLAQSHWTAGQVEQYLGVAQERIVIVPPGVDHFFGPASEAADEAEELDRRLGVRGRYVLQVGAFEYHKGGATLLAATDSLREGGMDLTLVRCGAGGGALTRPGLIDTGFVDDALLRRLYRGARVVAMPSHHEGFGLPVLEAMASGAPVVASRAGALPEAGGEAAVYVEPGDVAGFAGAIGRLVEDDGEWQRRRTAGIAHAATFPWARAATAVMDVLRETSAR